MEALIPDKGEIFHANKKKTILVLGSSGSGKSSFCFHLTQNPVFVAENGPHSETKTFTKGEGNGFLLFDTVGFFHEDFPKEKIHKTIEEGLANELTDELDAVCLVINSSKRTSLKSLLEEKNKYCFITPSNTIIIFTNYDKAKKKTDFNDTQQILMKFAQENLVNEYEEKSIFWINDCPDNDDEIRNDPKNKEIYKNMFNKFDEALKHCKSTKFQKITLFFEERKKLYMGNLWEILKDPSLARRAKDLHLCLSIVVFIDANKDLISTNISAIEIRGGSILETDDDVDDILQVGYHIASKLIDSIACGIEKEKSFWSFLNRKQLSKKKLSFLVRPEEINEIIMKKRKEIKIQKEGLIIIQKPTEQSINFEIDNEGNSSIKEIFGNCFHLKKQFEVDKTDILEIEVKTEKNIIIKMKKGFEKYMQAGEKLEINLDVFLEMLFPETKSIDSAIGKLIESDVKKIWGNIFES